MYRLLPLLLLALPLTAQAEVYHLKNGTQVRGGTVWEAEGVLTVMDERGKLQTIKASELKSVDPRPVLSKRVLRVLKQAQAKFFKKRQRAARKVLRKYGRAKTDAERAALKQELGKFKAAVLVKPLGKALKDSRPATRALALRQLKAIGTQRAVVQLVRAAIVSKHKKMRPQAHQAAMVVDKDLTRRYYEAIAAMPTKPSRRVSAIDYVQDMGGKNAVPGLIYVIEHVEMEIRAQLATAGSIKRVPVNLGTIGGAGLQVPIELPEMQMISVQTKVSVPTLRAIANRAAGALKALTGEDHGKDTKAWRNWWSKQPEAKKKAKSKGKPVE